MRVPHVSPDHYWSKKASYFVAPDLQFEDIDGILETSERTLAIWFKGQNVFEEQMVYGPVIREFSSDGGDFSWFGFIHAYLLKQLGADQATRTDLHKIAEFLQKLEQHHEFYCPLGTQQAWEPTEYPTIKQFQEETQLPSPYHLITTKNGELTLTPAAQDVYNRIEWEGGWARRLILQYPPVPEDAPIYMDPLSGAGFPTIRHTNVVYLRNRVADWKWGDAEYMVGAIGKGKLTISDVDRAVNYALKHNINHDPPFSGDDIQRYDEYDQMLAEQKAAQETEEAEKDKQIEEKVLQPT